MAARNEVAIDLTARNNATRELDAASRTLEQLGVKTQQVGFIGRSMSQVWAGAMLHVGESIKNFAFKGLAIAGDSIIGFNSRVEQAMIGFTTMLGSAAKAQGFMEELQQFAASTPFEFDGLRQSANLIMAMGFEAKEVIPLLTAAGDAVAALGLGTEAVQRVVYALGQMRSAGRVTGQDMMQLASMGIPAWKMLADSIGKSVMETKKLAEQGKIDAETAIKAITTAITEGNMGGMMAAQAKTFNGAVSTIKDTIQIVTSQAFKPLFDEVSRTTVGISEFLGSADFLAWADGVREALNTAIEGVMKLVDVIVPIAASVLPPLSKALGDVLGLLGMILTVGGTAFGGILTVIGPLLPIVVSLLAPSATFLVTWRALSMVMTAVAGKAAMGALLTSLPLVGGLFASVGNVIRIASLAGMGFTTTLRVMTVAMLASPLAPLALIAVLVTLAATFIDVGKAIDTLAMDFGSMGQTVDRLTAKVGGSRNEMKVALSDMMDAFDFTFDEAAYVMDRFGDDADEMGETVNDVMDRLGVSVGQASDMAAKWGDDWAEGSAQVEAAMAQTGVSWDALAERLAETHSFVSATDRMNMMLDAAERGPEAWKALMTGYEGVDEATKQLGEDFELVQSQIETSNIGIVDSVKQTVDGIAVTLTDGTVIVGKTADEVMGQVTAAAEAARDAVVQAMSDMIAGIRGMFETDTQIRDAWQGLIDRMDDPYTDAERLAGIFGLGMPEAVQRGLASGDSGLMMDVADQVERMLDEYEALEPGGLENGSAATLALKKGMDDEMDGLIDWLRDEKGIILDNMTLKEAKALGLDALWQYNKGMKDNAYLATNSAANVRSNVAAVLDDSLYDDGKSVGVSWANGLRSSADYARLMAWEVAAAADTALHGLSPPKEGPLSDIDIGGRNVGIAWGAGLREAAGAVRSDSYAVAQAAKDGLAGISGAFGGSFSGSFGGGPLGGESYGPGGGVTIVNHFGAGSVRSDDDIHAISRQLAMQIRMEQL